LATASKYLLDVMNGVMHMAASASAFIQKAPSTTVAFDWVVGGEE
jgi:hypothetical protein